MHNFFTIEWHTFFKRLLKRRDAKIGIYMWNIGGISKYYYKIARYKFKISSCLTLMIQTIILDIYRYKWEAGNGVNAKIWILRKYICMIFPTKHKNSKGVKRSPFENLLTKKLEPNSTVHWWFFFLSLAYSSRHYLRSKNTTSQIVLKINFPYVDTNFGYEFNAIL